MSLHIEAKPGEIAPRVILSGDSQRTLSMAGKYLQYCKCINEQRGALGFTGIYKGQEVSFMTSGMGIPSMLIYATELCRDYGCKRLIRTGTGASYKAEMALRDIVLSQAVCTTSSINDHVFNGTFAPIADFSMLCKAYNLAKERRHTVYVGNTVCNDRLYRLPMDYRAEQWRDYGVLCSEMEGAALYTVAAQFGCEALMMVSILSYMEIKDGREVNHRLLDEGKNNLDDMIMLALDTVLE